VVLDVAGSNPVAHPNCFCRSSAPDCPFRRAVRASDVRFWERTVRFWESPRGDGDSWPGWDSQIPECSRLMPVYRTWLPDPGSRLRKRGIRRSVRRDTPFPYPSVPRRMGIWCVLGLRIPLAAGAGDAGVVRENDGLNTITQAELHKKTGDMGLDRGLADNERGGDLGV
jgi:hypothetical protein